MTVLEGLIRAVTKGPRETERWMDAHAKDVTLELAAAAYVQSNQAVKSRKFEFAGLAAIASTYVYRRLGRPREALVSSLVAAETEFMKADTPKLYAIARKYARDLLAHAVRLSVGEVAFRASILAADCAYFASESANNSLTAQEWVREALGDLAAAATHADQDPNSPWLPRVVSLLAVTLTDAWSRPWFDEKEEIETLYRAIAAMADRIVPVEFEFPGRLWKSHQAALMLATLSYDFGQTEVADARTRAAALRAEQAGEIERWVWATFTRYTGGREKPAPYRIRSELRPVLRRRGDECRLACHSRAARLWIAQALGGIWGVLLRDQLTAGGAEAADVFGAVETIKSRLLLDELGGHETGFATPALATRAAEMERDVLRFPQAAHLDLLTAEYQLSTELPIGSIGFDDDSDRRGKELAAVEAFYTANHAGFGGTEPVTTLGEVRVRLEAGEAIILYCIPPHHVHPAHDLWALAITRDQVEVIPIPLDWLPADGTGSIGTIAADGQQPVASTPLGSFVVQLRLAIQDPDEVRAQQFLNTMYRLLIAPLVARGFDPDAFKRWIIVPHGMLHSVPFTALRDDSGHYLVERVALSVVPSASVWCKLVGRQGGAVTSLLGFANPELPSAQYVPLPNAEAELNRVTAGLGGLSCSLYRGIEATLGRLRAEVVGKNILHIASHGEFPEQDPIDFHRVLLTPAGNDRGAVTAEILRRLDLGAAHLVVLSVCNGGVYRFGPGDEPYGLMAAALVAGAQNMLSTLWPLADAAGADFVPDFYARLIAAGPAEALRHACRQAIARQRPLNEWALFVLVGPGRPAGKNA